MHSDYLSNGKLKANASSSDKKEDFSANSSMYFKIVTVEICSTHFPQVNFCIKAGSLLDDAATYSGLGEQELHFSRSKLNVNYNGSFEDLFAEISHPLYWKYGT